MKRLVAVVLIGILTCTSTPSSFSAMKTQAAPTSFGNLFKNRKGISFAAWSKLSSQSSLSSIVVNVKVLTGPMSKPWYPNPNLAINRVASIFSDYRFPTIVYLIQYKYADLMWAEKTLKSLATESEYENMFRNEGGHILDSNCQAGYTCMGSKAILASIDKGFILQGIPQNKPTGFLDIARSTTGQLESHEFFHLMQDMALGATESPNAVWPPQWVPEGSAEWLQNASVNSKSFQDYFAYIQKDSASLIVTPQIIEDYLNLAITQNNVGNYDTWWDYNLGSRVFEILVALYGPNSILDFYKSLGQGNQFYLAFKSNFGVDWKLVQPIIAKTIAANLKDRI